MYGLSGLDLRRSQITFRSSHGFAEAVDFRYLERAREPVSRSKAGVQGKVADVFSGRSRHAESQNELRAFQVLLATGLILAFWSGPAVAVNFGPPGRCWLRFVDGATEA